MINQVDANLWELERPLRTPGLRLAHRMTVARLASGDLWVHSPVAFEDAIARNLATLGTPRHFIAPSTFHDLHWPDWFRRYPDATFYCAPGVKEEHPELPFQRVLSDTEPEPWEAEFLKLRIDGMPRLNEFVFLQAATRSLLVADLLFNLDPSTQPLLGKLFLRLNGIHGRVGCSRLFRWYIKDRLAFAASIKALLRWDVDRIVPGHGGIIATGGRDELVRAFTWLGPDHVSPANQ